MSLKEQLAAQRLAKQQKKIARSAKSKPVGTIHNKLLDTLNDMSYKLRNNKVTVGDTYSLLLLFQHCYFIEHVDDEAANKWLGIKYMLKIKQAIKRILESIIDNHCRVNDDGFYEANPNNSVTIYKQTRGKLIWFIERTYKTTANELRNSILVKGGKQKMAARIAYAKRRTDLDLLLNNSRIANFIHQ